jgi:hypothetical protein
MAYGVLRMADSICGKDKIVSAHATHAVSDELLATLRLAQYCRICQRVGNDRCSMGKECIGQLLADPTRAEFRKSVQPISPEMGIGYATSLASKQRLPDDLLSEAPWVAQETSQYSDVVD